MDEKPKPFWKRTSTYVLVGIPSVIVFFANTKPDEATSNLAGWAKLFGINYVPQWLASHSTDIAVTLATVGGGFAGALTTWFFNERKAKIEKRREEQLRELRRREEILDEVAAAARAETAVQPRREAKAPPRSAPPPGSRIPHSADFGTRIQEMIQRRSRPSD